MVDRPFFTIVTPTYNRPDKLERAIKSVLKQTFRDFEMVIVNDGSTVDYSYIETITNELGLKYFYRENNGRSAARNFGIEQAKGQYICLLDDDDAFIENHLEVLFNIIKQQKYEIALFRTLAYGVLEEEVESIEIPSLELSVKRKNDLFEIENNKYINFLGAGAVAVHKEIFNKFKFNPKLVFWEDIDLWLRISPIYPFYKINQFTVKYILHDNNTISWNEKNLKEKLKTLFYFKKHYKTEVPNDFINQNIYSVSLGIADILSRDKDLSAFKYLRLAASNKPIKIFSRHFIGILKNFIAYQHKKT